MMIETIFGLTIYIEGEARVIDYETLYRITSKENTSIKKILFPDDVAFFLAKQRRRANAEFKYKRGFTKRKP